MIKMDPTVSTYLLECFGENCETVAKKVVYNEIQKICNDVGVLISNTDERKYSYNIADEVKSGGAYQLNLAHPNTCLNDLLEAIKKTFSGCNITIDPLETFITIDWS
jgi:hypothetical protein